MRPGAEDLDGGEHTDPGLGQQLGCHLAHEDLKLGFQVIGLGLEGKRALRGGAQRHNRRTVLGLVTVSGPQPRTAIQQVVRVQLVELMAQGLGGRHDEGLEMVHGPAAVADGTSPGAQQYPQGLAWPASARLGEMRVREGLVAARVASSASLLAPLRRAGWAGRLISAIASPCSNR